MNFFSQNKRNLMLLRKKMSWLLSFFPLLSASLWLGLLFFIQPSTAKAAAQPNIVLIMADDMGFECLNANGCEGYHTPNLDKLAANGARFTQAFANPKCTQSRTKLMTGMHNARNYKKFSVLDRQQKTFAHYLKAQGYKTAIAGKWQLGKEADSPQHFGFEQSWLWQHTRKRNRKGTKHDTRYSNPQLEFNGKSVDFNHGEYAPDILVNKLKGFITENKAQPFLVYYSMILPHWPFVPTPDSDGWDPKSLGSSSNKGPSGIDAKINNFRDMVAYADKKVGQLVAHIDALNLRENTLIIFVGDNGGATPLATICKGKKILAAKGKLIDEGTRVPLVINWPENITPRVSETDLVELSDIFVTMMEFSGVKLPAQHPTDGVSLKGLLVDGSARDKSHIQMQFADDIWVRNINYGVKYNTKSQQYRYEAYQGHYHATELEYQTVEPSIQQILEVLKANMVKK